MPKINVYLSDALASAVKQAGVPVSAVCQAALSDAVTRVERARRAITLLRDPSAPNAAFARLSEGLQQRMTPRLVTALQIAASSPGDGAESSISSLDLLRGLLEEGENLAVGLLVAQEIDPDTLREAIATEDRAEAPSVAEPDDTLFARMTMPARTACAAALEAVVELGHNYVGCEHLMVGLVASDGDAAELLSRHGVRAEALRHSLTGAIAGVVHERSTSTGRAAGAFAELTRRLEAVERQLAQDRGA